MKRQLAVIVYCSKSIEDELFKQKGMLDVLAFHQDSYDVNEGIHERCSEFFFKEERIEEMSKELDEEITYQEIIDTLFAFLVNFSVKVTFEKTNPFITEIEIES